MASHQFLSMKNFLWQSESLEKSKLDGKWHVLIEVLYVRAFRTERCTGDMLKRTVKKY